jgi:predicted Fe-S protein YdhL (DUF1289 family)
MLNIATPVLLVTTITAIWLAGCSSSQPATVDWYMAHQAERTEKIKWCNQDMARAIKTDCLNAAKADERANLANATNGSESFKFVPNKQYNATPQNSKSGGSAGAQEKGK